MFGSLTGVSLDGHIILSSADVRNSWLELIKRTKEYDVTLQRIPAVEKTVSRVLRDIKGFALLNFDFKLKSAFIFMNHVRFHLFQLYAESFNQLLLPTVMKLN